LLIDKLEKLYHYCVDHNIDELDPYSSLEIYRPSGVGNGNISRKITLEVAESVFPVLRRFVKALGHDLPPSIELDFLKESLQEESSDRDVMVLGALFNRYGSDKARHGYHWIYGSLFSRRSLPSVVLEIGLGSNFLDTPSNMGNAGRPGASLRAFRDFFPEATIIGADVDQRVLFSEERIATYHVDQTEPRSFGALSELVICSGVDLIIDDGLHAIHANLNTLGFGLAHVRVGGFVVIEDIPHSSRDLWDVVRCLIPSNFSTRLFSAKSSLLLVVERLS